MKILGVVVMIIGAGLMGACGSGVGVRKAQVKYLKGNESGVVSNKAFKKKPRRYGEVSMLSAFRIMEENVDSVWYTFADNGELVLRYQAGNEWCEYHCKGSFKRKGYYEYYINKERVQIPPLIPILFSRSNIDRVRLAQTLDGDLIVDQSWAHSGNIFIIGAGESGRRQSFFKQQH